MRRFSKKLAFALAAAMVLVTAAPAAQAKAASDFSLNRTSATLYVNKGVNDADKVAEGLAGNVQKYDFNLKNKPADWKDYGYAWSTSNDKVATVVSGGVTTAVGVGKATISCVITDKATGEIVDTLKATVNVKANASKVTITNPDVDGTTVKVGDTVDLNRSMSDEKGMTSSKRGQYVTDLTKWVVEPAEGVTVDQSTGKFTFTEDAKAGDYTLSCYTYQSDKYPTKTAESDKITVTLVKNTSFEVEQVTPTKFTLKFADAVKSLGALNVVRVLTIADTDYEIPAVTAAPVLAQDGMSATVEFFNATANNEVYKFTIDGFEAPVVKTVKIGAASEIKVSADATKGADYPIVVGTTANLVATLYDANGVEVTTAALAKSGAYIEFIEKTPSEEGKYSVGADGSIWFEGANIPCEVVVVYHSGEYNDNGDEVGNVEDTFTFVSQAAPAQVVTNISATIKLAVDGDDVDLKSTSVALGTDNAYLVVKPTISNKKADETAEFVNGAQYESYGVVSFEETNNNYFAVSRESDATLYLFQEGIGQVVVYITNDKGVKTAAGVVTVTVTAPKSLNKVTLSTNSVTVGMVPGLDEAEVKFVAKNNYNEDWKQDIGEVKIEAANNLAKKVAESGADAIWYDGTSIKIDGSEFGAAFLNEAAVSATLTYKVKVANKWESLLTITVKKENTNAKATYSFEKAAGNWGDVTRLADKDKDGVKSITFDVYEMNNGVKVGGVAVNKYVDKSKLTEADKDQFFVKVTKNGQDITEKTGCVDFGSFAVSGSAVSGSSVTLTFSGIDKDGFVDYSAMGAGNYSITLYQCAFNNGVATYRTLRTISGATTVDAGKYTFVSMKSDSAASDDDAALRACFNINGRDGKNTENANYTVEATKSASSNTIFVKSITFVESVGDANVAYKVTINKPITLKAE